MDPEEYLTIPNLKLIGFEHKNQNGVHFLQRGKDIVFFDTCFRIFHELQGTALYDGLTVTDLANEIKTKRNIL